ncbi:MAG: ABC transporter permease [Gammaproteobacteria bacterium]|nr:ABC transporter permease [Gammaproteobacteria bacterium]
MQHFLITRLASAAIVVFGVTSLVFFMIHLIPGDPVEVMLGESARVADRENLRHALGLDRPVLVQWLDYLYHIARLDFGVSLHSKESITSILLMHIPATIELTLIALLFAIVISLPLGILAALNKNSGWDRAAMTVSLLGVSIPNFLMGPLLILLFSMYLGWLPVSGRDAPESVILPALTLGTAMAAILSRMVRATLLEVINEDYIRTARAKGLSRFRVILLHALPNTLLPVITLLGLQLGALLAGAVITEVVFSWPGIGQLTIDAIHKRDYPLVQSCILLISLTYVLVNIATDILYCVADPRIRLGQES